MRFRAEGSRGPQQFDLASGQSENLDFELEDAADAQLPWTVRREASYGRYTSEVYQTCWPGVLNGSMERHVFRKPDFSDAVEPTKYGSEIVHNIPDWWWGQFSDRSPRLSRNPSEHPIAFDNQVAFDGQWSLRLDPTEEQPVMQYLFVGVTPETRYRISARIRRMEHHPKTGMALVQHCTDENGERQSRNRRRQPLPSSADAKAETIVASTIGTTASSIALHRIRLRAKRYSGRPLHSPAPMVRRHRSTNGGLSRPHITVTAVQGAKRPEADYCSPAP